MTVIPRVPHELFGPAVACFNPRRVILLGSHTRSDARPAGDFDRLVDVDDALANIPALHACMASRRGYHNPADVIPVHEATFQRKARDLQHLGCHVVRQSPALRRSVQPRTALTNWEAVCPQWRPSPPPRSGHT